MSRGDVRLDDAAFADSTFVRRGAVQLLRLVGLATELAAAPDLDALLRTITTGLTELLQAERTTIYVHDAAAGEIWSRMTDQLEIHEIRLPVGKGVAGQVARSRQLLNVPDVSRSEFFSPEIDRRTGFVTRSLLAAPMLNLRKDLIGVVEVINKRVGSFTDEDQELLRLFAGYAANAIESALLDEQMRRRERLAAVGSFAGTIVHDVKNLLALLSSSLDLVGGRDARDVELLGIVRGEVDKIVDLTSEVLDYAQGATARVKLVRTDVDEAIGRALALLARDFEIAGLRLEHAPGGAGTARLDVSRFRRVIVNLAQNARKVLARDGTLRVRTRRDGARVRIELEDDGPGIPAEIRGRVFTPFVCAGERSGTGLGLAIARSIVEAHGGTISARDATPRGTVFEIDLPAD